MKRAATSGGPYTVLASHLTSPAYIDSTAKNGTTYYYVVSAADDAGEGGDSAETSATPTGTGTNVPWIDALLKTAKAPAATLQKGALTLIGGNETFDAFKNWDELDFFGQAVAGDGTITRASCRAQAGALGS